LIQIKNDIGSEVHEQHEKKDLIRRFEAQIEDTEQMILDTQNQIEQIENQINKINSALEERQQVINE
jgi:prefoldin subunit 5